MASTRYLSSCRALATILLPGVVLLGSGCSAVWYRSAAPEEKSGASHNRDNLFSSEAPLDVNVAQSFFDRDGKLHVKVMLKPKVTLPTSDLAVSLLGLKDGEPQVEITKRVAEEFGEAEIKAGSLVAVNFELIPPEVSEYQIRASWGEEGREAAAKAASLSPPSAAPIRIPEIAQTAPRESEVVNATGATSLGELSLRQLRVEEKKVGCENGCDRELTVVIELQNGTTAIVGEAALAVRLVWVNEGEELPRLISGPLRPDEEEVRLSGLALQPGQKRQIRVAIDRALPELAGGSFVPSVRLIE